MRTSIIAFILVALATVAQVGYAQTVPHAVVDSTWFRAQFNENTQFGNPTYIASYGQTNSLNGFGVYGTSGISGGIAGAFISTENQSKNILFAHRNIGLWALGANGISGINIGLEVGSNNFAISGLNGRAIQVDSGDVYLGRILANGGPSNTTFISALTLDSVLVSGGSAGISGMVLVSAGPTAAPVWTAPGSALSSAAWLLNGNTNASLQTLGTLNNFDLPIVTNGSERMRILKGGNVGINTIAPSEILEVKNGNLLLSNSGSAGILKLQNPAAGHLTTFTTGSQSADFNYTLPTTAPTANQVLTSAGGATSNLNWSDPVSLVSNNFVEYNINTQQATATPRTNALFNVAYASGAANADASGALITSSFGTGASGNNATGLTISATAGNTGTATGLSVGATGGSTNYGLLVTGGNVGIGTSAPGTLLQLGNPGTKAGALAIAGLTSGTVTILSANAAGNWSLTLPSSAGSNGNVLTNTGGGVTTWASPSSLAIPISTLTAAIATNTIDNTNYAQNWQWSTLAGGNALALSSTSTAAASNTQTVLNISLSGATVAAGQSTYGMQVANTHTGSGTNVGALFTASGGSNNYPAIFSGGNVGIGTTAPTTLLQLGTAGTTAGTLSLAGLTSGLITINTPNTTATWTLTLPAAAGSNGNVLTNTGGGVTQWASPSSLAIPISTLTPAIATNTINNIDFAQVWQWNSLSSNSALSLTSSSTAAASNTQTLLNLSLTGANGTAGQATYGVQASNAHTGSGTNVAGYFSATSGLNNYGIVVPNGNVGIGNSAPAYALDVNTGSGAGGGITIDVARIQNTQNAATNNGAELLFGDNRGTTTMTNVAAIAGVITSAGASGYTGALTFSTITGPSASPTEKVRIDNLGDVGINTTLPSQLLEVKNGNALLSNSGTAGQLQMQGPSGGHITTFAAQTQANDLNYLLPATSPSANDILTSTGGASSTLVWSSPATLLGGSFVKYNVSSTQNVAVIGNYLWDVAYAASAAATDAAGARITSLSGSGGSQNATGLTIIATATGATATGLNVSVSGGGTNYSGLFTGGYVGIGTATPTAQLQVIGAGPQTTNFDAEQLSNTATNTTSTNLTKIGLDVQSTGFWTGAGMVNTGLNVNVGGGSTNYAALFIGGNVGIATTTPSVPLDVLATGVGGTVDVERLQNNIAAATNSGAQLLFAANRTTGGMTNVAGVSGVIANVGNTTYGGALVFSTASNAAPAERVRIDSIGNVGIGTQSPGQKLDVQGNIRLLLVPGPASSQLQFQNPAGTAVSTFQAGAQSGNINYTLPTTAPNTNDVLVSTTTGSPSTLQWGSVSTLLTGSFVQYDIASGPQNSSLIHAHNLFNVAYSPSADVADAAGAVITSAAGSGGHNASGLAVTATASGVGTSTALSVTAGGGTTNYAALFTGGNVGIGTATPAWTLDVAATGAQTSAITGTRVTNSATTATTSLAKIGLDIQSTGTWNAAGDVNTGLNVNATGGTTNYAALLNGGNVGIGTTTPSQQLEVKGGNVLLSTASAQIQFQGVGTGLTSVYAGAQGSTNLGYVWPITTPNANDVLSSTGGATSQLQWTSPSALLASSFVEYNITSTQNNAAVAASNYLYDVAYSASANGNNSVGARITSVSGTTAPTNATGLTIVATANTTGTSTALNVTAGGGSTNYAGLFNGGFVGIGTMTPSYPLDVLQSGIGGIADVLRLQNNIPAAVNSGSEILFSENRTTSGQTSIASIAGQITNIGQNTYTGSLLFSTSNDSLPYERMRIDNFGNVGIGTIAPGGMLDVSKSLNGNPSLTGKYLSFTTSPFTDTITAASGTATNMVFNSIGQNSLLARNAGVITTNVYNVYISGPPSKGTNESITNTTALNIASGAVGAATNSYGLRVAAATGATNNYAATFTGNVGFGLATPAQPVDISGNLQFSGALMPNSLAGSSGNLLVSQGAVSAPIWQSVSTALGSTAWLLGGNNVASAQTLGTTSNFDFPIITHNIERMRVLATGNVGIGSTTAATLLQLGTSGGTAGTLSLAGSSSGLVTMQTANAAGTWSWTLPVNAGTNKYLLMTDGTGISSWTNPALLGVAISALTPATVSNTIDNTNFAQNWQWSTLAGGNGIALSSASTAAASNSQTLLNLSLSANNASAGQTTYAMQASNAHGGSGTNVAGYFSATTGSNNYAIVVPNGNVGIGNSAPAGLFSVGSASQFQINSTGGITAATGIVSSGTITFSGLNAGGIVKAGAGSGTLSLATAGTDYENPLTFTNGLTRATNTVSLGGTLTANTTLANAGFNFNITGIGNVGIGTATPGTLLQLGNSGTKAGVLSLAGVTSGLVTVNTQTAAGTWTMTLPTGAGTSGWLLQTDGTGITSWVNPTSLNVPISSLTPASANNTIDNADHPQSWTWNTLSSNTALNLSTTSTGAASNTQTMLNVSLSGVNGSSQTTYGIQSANNHGGGGTNIAGYFSATNGTNNYGLIVPNGNVGIGTSSPSTMLQLGANGGTGGVLSLAGSGSGLVTINTKSAAGTWALTLPTSAGTSGYVMTTDGTGIASWTNPNSLNIAISALAVATATNTIDNVNFPQTWQWNSLTSNSALSLTSSSAAAASNTQTLLNLSLTNANTSAGQTTYDMQATNTHGGSGTNVAGYFSASGGSNNYGLLVAAGNVGIGNTAPAGLFSVGTTSQFQINSTGAVTAATGITSSGTITFSGLNAGGMVKATAGSGVLTIGTGGTDYENPLTFTNGLTRATNTVSLGGTLSSVTTIATGGNNFMITGTGNTGIRTSSPGQALEVGGSGNILLSNTSHTAGQLQLQGTSTGVTTIAAGTQGSTTINYILPTAQATAANQVMTNDGTGQLLWSAAGTTVTSGVVTISAWGADQNNLGSVVSNPNATIFRVSASVANVNITGVDIGSNVVNGRQVTFVNVGAANTVTFEPQNAGSTSTNQIITNSAGANVVINPNDSITLWYDSATGMWRLMSKNF